MKLKIRLSNNKIIAGALMSIALINSGCNDFLNKVQPQGQESSITFHADSRQCRTCHCWAV